MKCLHFYLPLLLLCSFEGISSQSMPDYTIFGGSGESGSGESGSGGEGITCVFIWFACMFVFLFVVVVVVFCLFVFHYFCINLGLYFNQASKIIGERSEPSYR